MTAASPDIDLSRFVDLSGRAAIVTGASSGFGARFCRVLAAAGASVVRGPAEDRLAALAAEVPAVVPRCDVADDDSCRALVATTLERFGRADVLVNNAGASDSPERVESEDLDYYRAVMDVNINACFVLASLVGPTMIDQRSGSVINIGSVHGQVGSSPNNQAAYVISKHAVVGLTWELALQWARHNVRVNCIVGYFETELTAPMFESEDQGLGWITRNTPCAERRGGRARRGAALPGVGRADLLHRPGDLRGRWLDRPLTLRSPITPPTRVAMRARRSPRGPGPSRCRRPGGCRTSEHDWPQ